MTNKPTEPDKSANPRNDITRGEMDRPHIARDQPADRTASARAGEDLRAGRAGLTTHAAGTDEHHADDHRRASGSATSDDRKWPTSEHEKLIAELQALPELTPPGRVWAHIERATRPPRRRSAWPWAMAASLFAAVIAIAVLIDPTSQPTTLVDAPGAGAPDTAEIERRIDALAQRSREIERDLRAAPRLVRVDRPALQVLSGRIAAVDADLSSASMTRGVDPVTEQLWRERVSLMESYRSLRDDQNVAAIRRVSY